MVGAAIGVAGREVARWVFRLFRDRQRQPAQERREKRDEMAQIMEEHRRLQDEHRLLREQLKEDYRQARDEGNQLRSALINALTENTELKGRLAFLERKNGQSPQRP